MNELTLEQALIISGYTGILACEFSELRRDIEKRLARPVFTHELAKQVFWDNLQGIYKEDFLALCHRQVKETP